MKLAFSTLGCADRSFEDILRLARRYDITGLELRGIGGELDNRLISEFQPENTEKTLAAFKRSGVRPVVLGTSCAFHDPTRYSTALEEGKACIDIASRLGIPYIRVFGNNIVGDEKSCIERIGSAIASLCETGRKVGNVGVLLEVHGDINTAARVLAVIEQAERWENFGIIWDIAHTHRVYSDNWMEFYFAVREHIRHVHVKDVSSRDGSLTQIGRGDIPIARIMKQMLGDGYCGYFSLEWEKKWHPEFAELEGALEEFIKTAETL